LDAKFMQERKDNIMAMTDPEMQRRLLASMRELTAACHRMRDVATLAKLEFVELAAAMDKDLTESLEDATAAAIQAARGRPPTAGPR
jgi:hypothetical protein